MSRGVSTEPEVLPFARLATLGLPPRVRSLLEGAFHAAAPTVEAALGRALDELDRDLVAHTERGSSTQDQDQCFASLREFRLRRGDFLSACRSALQRSLLALVDTQVIDEPLEMPAGGGSSAAEAVARDEALTLSQIASRAEIRAAAGLHALAYRFGVIAGTAPVEVEALPLGPHRLCVAIRAAARRFNVFPLHRLALYRRIDKCLFAEPMALYDAVNGYLAEHRVYAHLQLAPRPAIVDGAIVQAAVGTPQPAEVATQAQAGSPSPASPQEPEPTAAKLTQSLQIASQQPARTLVDASETDEDAALDAQFFRTLRERISGRRSAAKTVDGGGNARVLVARRELQNALRALQLQPLAPIMVGGKWANRTVAHVKQDLMNQLRTLSDGAAPKLRDEDDDSIDLIDSLFAHLLEAQRPNSLSHAVVCRLQIPMLRVALNDPEFFTNRTHPARRLLGAVVQSLADWVEDEDSDRQLIEKLQGIADRLARDYDDDLLAFDHCLDDLLKHLGSLQKKAEIAERRHVEAAKGRVKLDLARAAAFEVVRHRVEESTAPTAVIALLDGAWTDAIALSLLRQGVDHPQVRERIELIDQLLAIYTDSRPSMQRHRALEDLRGSLEEGLAAIGFHDNAIVAAWNDLRSLIDTNHESAHAAAAQIMAELISQKPRLGIDASAPGNLGLPAADPDQSPVNHEPIELNREELELVERLKQTEIGTWFEFTTNRRGDKARRRLCWFSPVTGRCLFLNVRGAKSEDRMLEQLAREMSRGLVRQVSAERMDPVERAWRAIKTRLALSRQQSTPAASNL